jgi:hypothetical protein
LPGSPPHRNNDLDKQAGIFNAVAERLNTASQHDGMDASMIAR